MLKTNYLYVFYHRLTGDFWIRIHNDDPANAADFGFTIDYKALV